MDINTYRAIALHQFDGQSTFEFGGAFYVGSEEETKAAFQEVHAAKIAGGDIQCEDDYTFADYCAEELSEVEEMDADEERDGYIVLTDEEADEKAKEYILNSVWAFTPSFLSGETGIDQKVFEAVQSNGRCEDNNDAILSMIDDEDAFVEAAIGADGRGHFLSMYDGNEHEETVKTSEADEETEKHVKFFIYRIN